MYKIFLVIAAILLPCTPVASDDFKDAYHNVPDPIIMCLNAPTRTCAFELSMATAISEKLNIERAKVLIAVSTAMAETGKIDDARMTLNMALEETRQSKISFAVDAKMLEIAPVYAMIGDVDRAIALAATVPTPSGRDRILSRSAERAGLQGDVAGARKISQAVENRRRAIWVSLKAMQSSVYKGNKQDLIDFADSIYPAIIALKRPADKLLAMVRLSMIYKAGGSKEKASMLQEQTRDIGESFTSYFMQARVAAAQLEFAVVGGNKTIKNKALEKLLASEKRMNSLMDKSSIANEMGSALAFAGHADIAAGYAKFYKEIREKSNYLKTVAQVSDKDVNGAFSAAIGEVLMESEAMENGYEADEVRMNLLHAARGVGDLALSRKIALTMQDDDNAAKALALIIPLL